jgi:nicotinamide-nucleotide amidase
MTLSLEKLAEKTGDTLKHLHLTLATAESCTGGGLSYWITSIPGSSDWFERGFVTYSDAAKIEMLGVSPLTIETVGAVSEETAREMAEGALRESHADLSIAITGIAGPAGGSVQKPVGMIWMAWAGKHFSTQAEVTLFPGDRTQIRMRAMEEALQKLLKLLAFVKK